MNRLETVRQYLVSNYAEMGHGVIECNTLLEWQENLSRLSNRYLGNELRYGWTLPFASEDSNTGFALAVYPALIVEQTEQESEGIFIKYLEAVEYRLNWHFAWFGDERKTNKIDAMLYEEAPGSMEILNKIQLRVLDQEAKANG